MRDDLVSAGRQTEKVLLQPMVAHDPAKRCQIRVQRKAVGVKPNLETRPTTSTLVEVEKRSHELAQTASYHASKINQLSTALDKLRSWENLQ